MTSATTFAAIAARVFGLAFNDLSVAQRQLVLRDIDGLATDAGFVDDLHDRMDEFGQDCDMDEVDAFHAAAVEIRRRIGGRGQLLAYAQTLEAAELRRRNTL